MKIVIALCLFILTGCASIRVEKHPAKYRGLDLRSIGFCVSESYYVSVLPAFKITAYNGSDINRFQCNNKTREIRREIEPSEVRYVCTMTQYGMSCIPKNRTDEIEVKIND